MSAIFSTLNEQKYTEPLEIMNFHQISETRVKSSNISNPLLWYVEVLEILKNVASDLNKWQF